MCPFAYCPEDGEAKVEAESGLTERRLGAAVATLIYVALEI